MTSHSWKIGYYLGREVPLRRPRPQHSVSKTVLSNPPWQRAAAPRSLPVDERREQARAPRHSRFHVTLSFAKQKSLEKWGSPWFLISSWFGHWPQPRSVLPQSGPRNGKIRVQFKNMCINLINGRLQHCLKVLKSTIFLHFFF